MNGTKDEHAAARKILIDALIADGAYAAAESPDYLRAILREGCRGFTNLDDGELVEAAFNADLIDGDEIPRAADLLALKGARLVLAAWDRACIDDDTGKATRRPDHLIVGGNAYWLEPPALPEPGCVHEILMTAPLAAADGAVIWTDAYEVEEAACPNYDAIRERLS